MINETVTKKKLSIDQKIKFLKEKERKIAKQGEALIYKKVNDYANKRYNEMLKDLEEIEEIEEVESLPNKINIICSQITDEHYSNGDCKRTIEFINKKDKKKDKSERKLVGQYVYWYTDSTIYINSEHNCEGITVHDCEMDGLDKDSAEEFLTEIDDMINWEWFK
jgi:transcription antitermination factor NusG